MIIPAFNFATFMILMNREPKFRGVGIEKCIEIVKSNPNGLSNNDVYNLFNNNMGNEFYTRDTMLFMLDVKEKEVILKHLESNEGEISKFCVTYFDLKKRVEEAGGIFVDDRSTDEQW